MHLLVHLWTDFILVSIIVFLEVLFCPLVFVPMQSMLDLLHCVKTLILRVHFNFGGKNPSEANWVSDCVVVEFSMHSERTRHGT